MSLYFDHSATTPIDPAVLDVVVHACRQWPGNPSSVHQAGRQARAAMEAARARLAATLNAPDGSIVFTASGSEANNTVIKGVALARAPRPTHLVVSAIEHDCVLNAARALAARLDWITLTEVRPGPDGRIAPEAIGAALRPETALVCLMLANNETGAIQPVAETARLAHAAGALLLTDAVQAPGRIALDAAALDCDFLTLSAHKFNGPRGIGALYARPGAGFDPLVHGGTQEGRRRAGTENLPAALGMALAAERAAARQAAAAGHLRRLEAAFLDPLNEAGLSLQINGPADDKLPGVLNLSLKGFHQDDLVIGMDLMGVAVSAGSACSAGVIEPSHVLRAMDMESGRVQSAIRVSFGHDQTEAQARDGAHKLIALCERLKRECPVELNR